jgi:hypothetical protein
MPSSHGPDRLVVAVDDGHAVANAGLPATLASGRNTQWHGRLDMA